MYAYEVNTSIAMYFICDLCNMHKRSIPQWPCIVYAINLINLCYMHKRSISQLCIMFTLIFWILGVHRGYMPRLHYSLVYVLATILHIHM